ncbi:GyrI-like domain-containing protein [Pelagicoccus sp. SDUM812003]|uniref:GyrI-like domain-containing protein n=1 Tax=Pelagicoccus sp. SDUM812003 TaxID=3041267 RepID=UPI0028100AD4|nr:GyrI-like domain-containing protein [Pelagicoccus sp. SDUM812003]MDQ8203810.1 GyrI-like domain-containing protein [Pelagicoccus sp. SDUM812003]
MKKIDYKKELMELYRPSSKSVSSVDVPPLRYLMIDGAGAPESKEFEQAMEALYPLAYTLKFMSKQSDAGIDFVVMPLEGLWWADDMDAYLERRLDEWRWTLMIMQPDCVSEDMVAAALERVRKKNNPAALDRVRFEVYEEGECAQIMHLGPYSEEGPNVERLHAFIAEQGKERALKHHEIYLSDPRRAAPEKLRTVLRQPMR